MLFRKIKKNKKIGLALGGGAVLGASHVGVLKAIEEYDIKIDFLAGTSIGAFVASLYAFGKTAKEIEEIAQEFDWFDISRISISHLGLLSNKQLGALIEKNIGAVNFEEAEIPLAMITTDISTGEKVILDKGDIATAVTASSCLPGIFKPVEIDGRLLVDGAIVENVPTTLVKKMGADFIIGVDLNARHSSKRPKNIIEVLLNTFDFTIMTATKLQTQVADLLIMPDLTSFNMVDTDQVKDLIEAGYKEAKKVLRKMKK